MNCSWIILIDKKVDKVLILKRSKVVRNPGQWCFPGGSSKKNGPRKLAKKELYEEVGVDIPKRKLFKALEIQLKKKDYTYYILFYDGENPLTLDKESKKLKWVKLKSLEHHRNQHQSIRRFVKYINENKYNLLKGISKKN